MSYPEISSNKKAKKATFLNNHMENKEKLKPQENTDPQQDARSLLGMSEISLWLDTYDDIFSDFDPRPYPERALSDDFLNAAEKASKENSSGTVDLRLLIPADKIDKEQENIIKKRLKTHFTKNYNKLKKEAKNTIKKGSLFTILGISLMFIATLIAFKYNNGGILVNFIIVVTEPAGWFLFWEGLDMAIFESKRTKADFNFYKKISKGEVFFSSY